MLVATFTISIRDAKNKPAYLKYYIDLSPTGGFGGFNGVLEDAVEYLQEVATRVNAVIRGAITDLSLSIKIDLPGGLRAFAELDSDVEEGALFLYQPPDKAAFSNTIPTFDHSLFPPNSINLYYGDEPTVNDLVYLLIQSDEANDWPAEYGGITNSRGEQLVFNAAPQIKKMFKP